MLHPSSDCLRRLPWSLELGSPLVMPALLWVWWGRAHFHKKHRHVRSMHTQHHIGHTSAPQSDASVADHSHYFLCFSIAPTALCRTISNTGAFCNYLPVGKDWLRRHLIFSVVKAGCMHQQQQPCAAWETDLAVATVPQVNFGYQPLKHCPAGYTPLGRAPSEATASGTGSPAESGSAASRR